MVRTLIAVAILLTACSSAPTPIQVGPDRWAVVIDSINRARAQNAALRGASAHCEKRGQTLNVIEQSVATNPAGGRPMTGQVYRHTVDLTFTCVAAAR